MSLPLPDSFNALLTEAECQKIDETLLPTRDRFNIRLKLYSVRYLSQIATQLNLPIVKLTYSQIVEQLVLDPTLQENGKPEDKFIEWFGNLLNASINPLAQIASESQSEIENLTLGQIVDWHRKHVSL